MSSFSLVIAIDGPSGSGKSTIASLLADKLNIVYIDTGAMYRALGHACHANQVPFESGEKMKSFLKTIEMNYGQSKDYLVTINGENLTKKIRDHEVSTLASYVSKVPEVRSFLLQFQRRLALNTLCVMEGRDIGTVVFPDAFCKFFVTASEEVRAQRRLEQLRDNGNDLVELEQVIKDVQKRDQADMNREVAPLCQAEDAFLIDSSQKSKQEILEIMIEKARDRASQFGIAL